MPATRSGESRSDRRGDGCPARTVRADLDFPGRARRPRLRPEAGRRLLFSREVGSCWRSVDALSAVRRTGNEGRRFRDLDEASIRRRASARTCGARFTRRADRGARLIVVKRDGFSPGVRPGEAGAFPQAWRGGAFVDARGAAADQIEARLVRGATEVDSSEIGRMRMTSARPRPNRLHSLRQRVPELRGHRDAETEVDTSTPARERATSSDRSVRSRHRRALSAGRVKDEPLTTRATSTPSVDLHLDRQLRVFRNNRT